jgi:hypothetical protein
MARMGYNRAKIQAAAGRATAGASKAFSQARQSRHPMMPSNVRSLLLCGVRNLAS